MDHGGRAYLSTQREWDPDAYFKPNLLGGSLEYDVNLKKVSCGCNGALYLVGMPGVSRDGTPYKSNDGMHYCDANRVDGNYCPEFDIMEANQWAYKAISHSCDAPNQHGYYDRCDHAGTCGVDVIKDQPDTAYGPGSKYTINTKQQFHVKVDFEQDPQDGELSSYTVTFTQRGREVKMATNQACKSELRKMTQDFKDGMTFAMSMWDGNLDWL